MPFAIDITTLMGTGSGVPYAFYAVLAVGFVAAVTLGSIAFYNSKRPVGWENKERPSIVPKMGEDDAEG